jgi:CBS domain-containing membrane protein
VPNSRPFASFRDPLYRIAPGLPGATWRGQTVAVLGAGLAVFLAALVSAWVHGHGESMPWLAPPMAASALLVFALPASPLAQPWPVVGGNCISALVGVAVGRAFGHGAVACAVAVALAIAAMLATRSLHPPGAAAAVLGATGGAAGWLFPFAPLGLNLVIVVLVACVFHRLSGHRYPHVAVGAAALQAGIELSAIREEDLDAVLAEADETFDIERDDLRMLLVKLEARLAVRREAGH